MQDLPGLTAQIGSVVLVVVGASLAASGVVAVPRGARQRRAWHEWALFYLYGFRRIVVGLCIAGAGFAWGARIDWLLAVCVCVGIGEWLESSYYIAVVEWGKRRGSLSSG